MISIRFARLKSSDWSWVAKNNTYADTHLPCFVPSHWLITSTPHHFILIPFISYHGPGVATPTSWRHATFSERVFTCHLPGARRHLDEDVNGLRLFCFIKRVCRQTVQSQIDYAASLHWLRRLPPLPSRASRLKNISSCENGEELGFRKKRKERQNRFVVCIYFLSK